MTAPLPFRLEGVTVRGKRLGTRLGYPTANLKYPPTETLPADGVYVALAEVDGRRYPAVLNQGRHPTAPEGNPTVETHLLGYPGGDLYGKPLTLTYLHNLRPAGHGAVIGRDKDRLLIFGQLACGRIAQRRLIGRDG